MNKLRGGLLPVVAALFGMVMQSVMVVSALAQTSGGSDDFQSVLQPLLSVPPFPGDQAPRTGNFYSAQFGLNHFPSLMVNCAGDMVMGFSGSSATNYISAFYTQRLANGYVPGPPRVVQAGTTPYYNSDWGDYSATTLDPTDDWSFWTVQQYMDTVNDPSPVIDWKTVIARIRPNP
jgi:hypothetical protein